MSLKKYSIGIDEVGRGPLAGPITVCAALFPRNFSFKKHAKILDIPLRDSKKLTPITREIWASYFYNQPVISYSLASVSARVIDRVNIRRAAQRAVDRALIKLARKYSKNSKKVANAEIFLDGGLSISPSILQKLGIHTAPHTIIRGDEKIPVISAASILAKVNRDRFMVHLSKVYKGYGFEAHKGYGTRAHIVALRKKGISPIHRKSFLKNLSLTCK